MTKTQKLKAVIVEKGLTQTQLAEKMGVNKGTLSRKINNTTPFTVEEVKKIAEILEIDKHRATEIFFN